MAISALSIWLTVIVIMVATSSAELRVPMNVRLRRVIFGVPLARGDLSYLTSIVAQFPHHKRNEGALCGGSLVSPSVVLTAAHCVFSEVHKTKATRVRVIVNDFALGRKDRHEQTFVTTHYDVHPQYYESNFHPGFDIALIYLPQSVDVCGAGGSITEIARLPIDPFSGRISLSDEDLRQAACYHSGWGVTSAGTNAVVAQRMRITGLTFYENDDLGGKSFVARGAASSRPCYGDSGGPVYCDVNGKRFVVGIASQIGHIRGTEVQFDDSVLECRAASLLESCDVRAQLPQIVEMLERKNLFHSLVGSYYSCFAKRSTAE